MAQHRARLGWTVLLAGAALLGTCVPAAGAAPTNRSPSSKAGTTGGWHAQASGTSQPLFAVSCFDASRCKAVGARGTLLYTRNGGATWRPQANPFTGSSTDLYRITCVAHSSTCYVIGRPDIVMVTHNGGVTWSAHQITLPGSATGADHQTCASGQEGDLVPRPALCRFGLLDLACLSATTCYVVATVAIPWGGFPGFLAPALFLTTDGGTTWSTQTFPTTAPCQGICVPDPRAPDRTPYPLEWISCVPGPVCRAGGETYLGSHEGYATLVITVRKPGAPWTAVRSSTGLISSSDANAVACVTATRCYGIWTTSPFAPGNLVWLSTNGGVSWNNMSSGSPKLRNAIACPGARICYSAGNQGSITASTNGGPFRVQPSGTSHDLYGITCVDLQTCYAVGNKGTIVARKTM